MDCKGLHCEGCGGNGGIAVLITLVVVAIAAAIAARAVVAIPWYAWATIDTILLTAITGGIWFVVRQLRAGQQQERQAITQTGAAIRAELQAPARPSRTELERQLAEAQARAELERHLAAAEARAALPPSQHVHFHNDTHIYGPAAAAHAPVAAPGARVQPPERTQP